jgi:hypothetical protein
VAGGFTNRCQTPEWAIQKAYRPDVKRAAQRLLQELDQPTSPLLASPAPAVALAEPQPFDQFTVSEIPVWLPFNIAERAVALATRYPPSDVELVQINDLLRRRANEQRAVEDSPARRRCSRSRP